MMAQSQNDTGISEKDGLILFHNRDELTYTFCYCEENVWQLCNTVRDRYPDQLHSSYCVFISNTEKMVYMHTVIIWDNTDKMDNRFHQPFSPCCLYCPKEEMDKYPCGVRSQALTKKVVLSGQVLSDLTCNRQGYALTLVYVYDHDYHVIFIHKHKAGSHVYDHDSTLSFPCPFITYAAEAIRPCHFLKPQYNRSFRVIRADEFLQTFASDRSHMLDKDKQWLKPPPIYPCIHTQESTNNLQEFISMDNKVGVGSITDYTGLCEMFINKTTIT